MARTPLFRELRRLLRLAAQGNRQKMGNGEFDDWLGEGHSPSLTRRKFLLGGAGLMSALTLPAYLRGDLARGGIRRHSPADRFQIPSINGTSSSPIPVAIVGGGISGLTAAYRLLYGNGYEPYPGVVAHVFEASGRIGGRIYTNPFTRPQDENAINTQFYEAGGEYMDSDNECLIRLAFELGVPFEKVRNSQLLSVGYWADGPRSPAEVAAAFRPLSKIIEEDIAPLLEDPNDLASRRRTPTHDNSLGLEKLDTPRTSLKSYLLEAAERSGGLVPHWLLNLILTAYIGEFGRAAEEQSALNLLTLIGLGSETEMNMFGPSDYSFRFTRGSSSIIEALHRNLPLGTVHARQRLYLIRYNQRTKVYTLFFDGAVRRPVYAKHVVLTVPLTMSAQIEGLTSNEMPLDDLERDCLLNWQYGYNTKLALGMTKRFWRLRPGPGSFAASSGTLLTATDAQNIWDATEMQGDPDKDPGILTAFLGGPKALLPSREIIPRVWKALDDIYPRLSEKLPQASAYSDRHTQLFNWKNMPYQGGAYTCAAPGDYVKWFGALARWRPNQTLHFGGEHTSVDYQGFMNGGAERGERVAFDILGLQMDKRAAGGRNVDARPS
jgi:monoamine oxidase